MSDILAKRFAAIFKGFTGRFGTFEILPNQPSGKQKGVARTLPGPLMYSNYEDHLQGKAGLGIIPLLDDNESACFGCIDIDKYPIDFAALEKDCKNIPVVITKSKSGGAHVWLFTSEPVPAKLIVDNLKAWSADLGFGRSEIFPKQTKRLGPDDAGNWINLPYFDETRVGFFDGQEQTLEDFLQYVESRQMNEVTLENLIEQSSSRGLFYDGPPCLATIVKKGLGPGTRNMVLLNVGSYFKKKDPQTFLLNLLKFNKEHLTEPLPESEINASIAKSLQRKSYPYQCNQEPLCSACNRSKCLKREFGVGGSEEELEVVLTGLTKINTDPPIWYINIDGVRVELADIDVLINQRAFRSLAAQTIHKLFSLVKGPAWERIVGGLLETVEVIDAPVDSSFKGQLGDEIREFLMQYAQDSSMEQVITHTVYVDRKEQRAYFRSQDLMKRLKRNIGANASPQKAWAYFKSHKDLDVKTIDFDSKEGGFIKLWSISIKSVYIPTGYIIEHTETTSPF